MQKRGQIIMLCRVWCRWLGRLARRSNTTKRMWLKMMALDAGNNSCLSNLETQTLEMLCDGSSIDDIQASLNLSAHTVKVIIENIMVKKQVSNPTMLVAKSIRSLD